MKKGQKGEQTYFKMFCKAIISFVILKAFQDQWNRIERLLADPRINNFWMSREASEITGEGTGYSAE